jgi:hypothetical protein
MKSLKPSNKMNNDIEKLIKNVFDDYELPYQDGAWESFQKVTDKRTIKNPFKWWIIGAAALLILICSAYFFQGYENQTSALVKKTSKNEIINSVNKSYRNESLVKLNGENQKSPIAKADINYESLVSTNSSSEKLNEEKKINENSETIVIYSNESHISLNHSEKQSVNEVADETEITMDGFPTFKDMCKNESISIDNKFTHELILKTPSGREIGIEANTKSELNLKETGFYKLGFLSEKTNYNFKEMSTFKVLGVPTLILSVDDNIIYKNGLPTINAEASASDEIISWKINHNSFNKSGRNAEFNLFNKGNYIVTAVVKNELGCEVSESKSIQIPEDYNLLAMSAFNPNSVDYRNNTFLPYALKERNSAFTMIILDPDNGGIVFETAEASNPWTGIDRRDGKMVASSKAYIWKVTIANPEPGERSEYKGTVVRVP